MNLTHVMLESFIETEQRKFLNITSFMLDLRLCKADEIYTNVRVRHTHTRSLIYPRLQRVY